MNKQNYKDDENEVEKFVKFLSVICIALTIFAITLVAYGVFKQSKPLHIYTFELSEMEDGVFAYRETITDKRGGYRCTAATICDATGNIYTVRGSLKIVNETEAAPYAVWKDNYYVDSDEITLYVPAKSVKILARR